MRTHNSHTRQQKNQSACQTRHEMFINLETRRANAASNFTYKESILVASKPVFGKLTSVRTRANVFSRSRMFDYTRILSLPESNCFPSSHGHYRGCSFRSQLCTHKIRISCFKMERRRGRGSSFPSPLLLIKQKFSFRSISALLTLFSADDSRFNFKVDAEVGKKRYMERLR
ncbi:hypothetical protein CEXT_531841 [Caerostris extrusa]|uniref:Uncharacterized protein n=1 Tax=Caerostris extrusa TaxID=172846 RepID=A0AAV4MXJ8_CAEEX|nr:hypothetical protein CEXT_531841 [Caerostris extrusa]